MRAFRPLEPADDHSARGEDRIAVGVDLIGPTLPTDHSETSTLGPAKCGDPGAT